MDIETVTITRMGELILRAWDEGIVYFQVYAIRPNPAFYRALGQRLPYERIVEVRTDRMDTFKSQVSFRGGDPFFGAATCGDFIGVTDDPNAVAATVQEARRMVVLPSDIRREKTADDEITLESPDQLASVVTESASPDNWQVPRWHPDLGDPALEVAPLRELGRQLLLARPGTALALETPEPGLLYVRGRLPDGQAFEVYSVPPLAPNGPRRLGVFLLPDTDAEVESYFDSVEDAVAFLAAREPPRGATQH